MSELRPLLQELLTELEVAVKAVMVSKASSLRGSALVDSVEFRVQGDSLVMWANDYYDFVDKGRRAGVKKVPITALLKFIKKRNLKGRNRITGRFITDVSLAFAIQTSIFKLGIRGKLFDVEVDKTIDQAVDVILDQRALDLLTTELDTIWQQ